MQSRLSSTINAIGGSIRSKILLISSGGWNWTCVLRIITLNEGTQRPTTEPGPPDPASTVNFKHDLGIYYDRTLSYTFEIFWKVSSYCGTNFLFRWSRVVTFVVHLIVNKKKNLSYTQLVVKRLCCTPIL